MKNFYIVANTGKYGTAELADRIKSYVCEYGGRVFSNMNEEVECVITIGGDGTLIQAARSLAAEDVIFAGVNMGTLGFLTDIEPTSIEGSLKMLLEDTYRLEERMMLTAKVRGIEQWYMALNDIVISRMNSVNVINYDIFVNDAPLASYRADGIIVSTPTGSTSYNLSAGGPIIDPASNLIVLTPICAHTLTARSVVFGPGNHITIRSRWREGGRSAAISVDGDESIFLNSGDVVELKISQKTTKLVRVKSESFISTLSRKLGG